MLLSSTKPLTTNCSLVLLLHLFSFTRSFHTNRCLNNPKLDLATSFRTLLRSQAFPVFILSARSPWPPYFKFTTLSSVTSISLTPPTLSFALTSSSYFSHLLSTLFYQSTTTSSLSHSIPPKVLLHFLNEHHTQLAELCSRPMTSLPESWLTKEGIPSLPNVSNIAIGKITQHVTVADHEVFFMTLENLIQESPLVESSSVISEKPLLYRNKEYTTVK